MLENTLKRVDDLEAEVSCAEDEGGAMMNPARFVDACVSSMELRANGRDDPDRQGKTEGNGEAETRPRRPGKVAEVGTESVTRKRGLVITNPQTLTNRWRGWQDSNPRPLGS
ncbi:hypothetical protein CO2235_MP80002 [Cupriavidus oxalaticus]|uniref:Uncharacterized protein n=1 Tax=Cupriavidus oxalaticus TaxID=96344 RepID=A0A976GDL2_9BURK|nr:hypothetical protein CO2235_MP80002 [Cupriavidus oxalaticus]